MVFAHTLQLPICHANHNNRQLRGVGEHHIAPTSARRKATLASMQQFSPPVTRLDAVLWFLRVQLWLSVVAFVTGLITFSGFFVNLGLQSLVNFGLPILILSLFPRVLASAVLGSSAREPLDFRALLGRCVGLSLFVGSLGRAIALTFTLGYNVLNGAPVFGSGFSSGFLLSQSITTALSFLLGFALAFGPAIRDGLRGR